MSGGFFHNDEAAVPATVIIAVFERFMIISAGWNEWFVGELMNPKEAHDAALQKTDSYESAGMVLAAGPIALRLPLDVSKELRTKGTLSRDGEQSLNLALAMARALT